MKKLYYKCIILIHYEYFFGYQFTHLNKSTNVIKTKNSFVSLSFGMLINFEKDRKSTAEIPAVHRQLFL